jgi:hypothetical protein
MDAAAREGLTAIPAGLASPDVQTYLFQLDATGMIMVLRDQISPSEWTALGLEVEAWSKVG